jgi:hypothetical protein
VFRVTSGMVISPLEAMQKVVNGEPLGAMNHGPQGSWAGRRHQWLWMARRTRHRDSSVVQLATGQNVLLR